MGDPRKSRRKWESPSTPWDKQTLLTEQELLSKYGLRNKREIWLARSIIRKYRHQARSLLGLPLAERITREKQLVAKLTRIGLIKGTATTDDILSLREENLLERRLQTLVFRKGLAKTIYQARQLIVHGHIAINMKRVTSPGYFVTTEEEDKIDYYPLSPFKTKPISREEVEE
ncbi:30S ribosomal protein S4 [Sulfolobales archaeon HS-7]|nr:30S ribosomal protein S4 [Sulfolobales archaeon HS-7]